MWQIWLIASGIFFVIEIFTVGFLIFWLGVAALIAMLISFITDSVILQTAVFVISSVLLIFATRPLTNKIAGKETIPTNVYSLIGKRGIVVEDIDWQKGTGQVKIDGELWSVKTNEQINISKGTEVEVENIEGVKVFVKPINITSNI
ncbi:membrane protein implicated in regulation of membrane protease activity [Clostridium sp. CAG:356]|nr:membrane protein implicated in regulation of membrane protease activity [Clostridium sp. CAG:356]